MDTNTKLRINGYGAVSDGFLVCYRTPEYRYEHEQLSVVLIIAPKDFAAKIVAAVDQPAALVGVSAYLTVMLFRPSVRNVKARHEFIFEGKQGLLHATAEGAPLDVGAYTWAGGRSPLTVARNALPPLFDDIVEKAVHAVTEFGATFGSLPTAAEIAAEAARQERLAKIAAEIAQGLHTPEKIAEREDNAMVAAHEGVEYHEYDGNFANLVLAARRRVARRKADAEAAAA